MSVYADRPQACRAYRCKTLLAVDAGAMPLAEAQTNLAQVAAARDTLLAAANCRSAPEAMSLVQSAKGAVPAFAMELLVVGRLVDLHIRPEDQRLTMGQPAAMPPAQ